MFHHTSQSVEPLANDRNEWTWHFGGGMSNPSSNGVPRASSEDEPMPRGGNEVESPEEIGSESEYWSVDEEPPSPSGEYEGPIPPHGHVTAHSKSGVMVLVYPLPSAITYPALFDVLRGCGFVTSCDIRPISNYSTGVCMAEVEFSNIQGARRLCQSAREKRFSALPWRPNVDLLSQSVAKPAPPRSRVLRIQGPKSIVNQRVLVAILASTVDSEPDDSQMRFPATTQGRTSYRDIRPGVLTIEFNSTSEASKARDILLRDLKGVVSAEYELYSCGLWRED
ncbi:hypothetical protein SAMD00023353_2900900 [Rosellinia necatrix]|uniref:RRM domain-containing protein n=1 Tax=Rosellinia necatrix TaxID=77044 RepID=A0A1W2TJL1_ROSNE|nr:hypothetical protein SAMD00023353_2900900 [Rosellinia necatrix]